MQNQSAITYISVIVWPPRQKDLKEYKMHPRSKKKKKKHSWRKLAPLTWKAADFCSHYAFSNMVTLENLI